MLLDVESRAGEHFDKYVRQFNLGLRVVKSQSVSGVWGTLVIRTPNGEVALMKMLRGN